MPMIAMTSANDHTVNKIALYSAIFAGVAYVGYSYVKENFGKKSRPRNHDSDGSSLLEYENHRRRIFLRRLSGSDVASSFLLGNGSSNGDRSRLVLGPSSVQERIKELNLRARHFAETIMAVQLHDAVAQPPQNYRSAIGISFSLQTSPTHTPRRIMEPIDFTNLASSRYNSTENLTSPPSSLPPLNSRWRSSRRSLRARSPDFSKEEMYESMEAESERLLDEREAELRKRLQSFEEGNAKVLTLYEAKSLVALLHAKDCETLDRSLVTISNCAAFTQNQESLREAGCILRLQHLAIHSHTAIKIAAMKAIANMALNVANQKEMEQIVPLLLSQIENETNESEMDDAKLTHQVLFTLTNIAALDDWHHHYISSLPNILDLVNSSDDLVSMQALRLLINLSTNQHMIQYLQSANATSYLWTLLDPNLSEAKLLRVVTLVANIVSSSSHDQQSSLSRRQLEAPAQDSSTIAAASCDKQASAFLNGASLMQLSHTPCQEVEQQLAKIAHGVNNEDILRKVEIIRNAMTV